jgi:hypothetical protein
MIGMGAKSITIVRAVTADFFFDCRAAEVPSGISSPLSTSKYLNQYLRNLVYA